MLKRASFLRTARCPREVGGLANRLQPGPAAWVLIQHDTERICRSQWEGSSAYGSRPFPLARDEKSGGYGRRPMLVADSSLWGHVTSSSGPTSALGSRPDAANQANECEASSGWAYAQGACWGFFCFSGVEQSRCREAV